MGVRMKNGLENEVLALAENLGYDWIEVGEHIVMLSPENRLWRVNVKDVTGSCLDPTTERWVVEMVKRKEQTR